MQANLSKMQKHNYHVPQYISKCEGNNCFSFAERTKRRLRIAPLLDADLSELRKGAEPVFGEIGEAGEIAPLGLENFLHFKLNEKTIYIFDNHNHAFYFWFLAFKEGLYHAGITLLHVDQHTDMRSPDNLLEIDIREDPDLDRIYDYTNKELNVGNFIVPALSCGLFQDVKIVNSLYDSPWIPESEVVFDLDIDFFVEGRDDPDYARRLEYCRNCLEMAKVATIASSPFFIDQDLAISVIKELLEDKI